jgi:hypothetical protein
LAINVKFNKKGKEKQSLKGFDKAIFLHIHFFAFLREYKETLLGFSGFKNEDSLNIHLSILYIIFYHLK